MAENLTPQSNIEIVRDLLSPYLDDEVTDEERALVNATLADSPELRNELETLRQTVALVRDLPRVPAPRPFTLTEADVQAVAPKPKKSFGLPAWFGGFAAAAALLVCVLAVGGVFLTSQFSSGGMVGDVAMAPQQAAMEQPAAEAPAEEAAPTQEEGAAEEVPAEEEPLAAQAETEAGVEEKAAVESTSVPAMPESAQDTANLAEGEEFAGEADTDRSGKAEGAMPAMPTPTPAALATMTPSPAPTSSPAPAALAAPAVSEPAKQDDLARKEGILRPLEIQNQLVRLSPGVIHLEGRLDVATGTILVVTLQRNGENFDQWAEPASLQTTAEANGHFSFNIVAADPTAGDLFAQEPATYQIIITSPDPDAPVIAFAYFDTFAPPAAAATETPTVAATLSPTVVALLTILPSNTPEIQATPTQVVEPASPVETPGMPSIFIGIIVILVIVVVIAIGLVVRGSKK